MNVLLSDDPLLELHRVAELLREPQDNLELALEMLLQLGLGVTFIRLSQNHVSIESLEDRKVSRMGTEPIEDLLADCAEEAAGWYER